ncbi:unnamed protein product [Aspergillus oryzae RIB40]|uniref:DNA, SC111 n=1 Tax=Aspergillus oryzae (strain ATCC 42149 / RIB 40) TaxID=510516 RepID=Q2U8B4_ASPOR|nr:unnamed protein product [Aspergillus oryzae RIB40]BAE62201.1 unnamed protein product [Aspergillus oryzae RIB40]
MDSFISVNQESYDPDGKDYYLGYREADFKRPFAKYYNPVTPAISDEVQKGLSASPWASSIGHTPWEAKTHMLRSGYTLLENGYTTLPDGTLYIAVRTSIPQITGDAYNWWFGWHLTDTSRYKLWNPIAHQYAWRYPNTMDWSNKSLPERYINTYSFISEFIGNDCSKLTIAFIDPQELGIDKSKFEEQGIEAMVVGRIKMGGMILLIGPQIRESKLADRLCTEHITSGFDNKSFLIHQVRRKPDGERELRSRFWIAGATPQVGHDLAVHCAIEMSRKSCIHSRGKAEYGQLIDMVE